MKKPLSIILTLAMIFSLAGCNGGGGGGDEGSASAGGSAALSESSVTLAFNFGEVLAMNTADKDITLARLIDFITMAKTAYAAPLYDYVTTLYIKVTGLDMSDIVHTQDISDVEGSFSVTLTVPNGLDRLFYVELKDRNGNVLYSGSITINVGDYQATPQDITIDVTIDGQINAEDYIIIGRGHLEEHKLELAFIAFDTAVAIDADHPVANFFRGFTRLLLLIQKDGSDADVTSPDSDITSALNLYLYGGLDDIYTSGDNIAPDIYNQNYGENLSSFFDSWTKPSNLATDEGVDLIESTTLPEIDKLINDLANCERDPVFYTTLTTAMHFDISSEIKVDRGDVYILGAIAYALKAYYNHILAYNLRTSIDWWEDNLDTGSSTYEGIQDVLDRDSDGVGKLVGSLSKAKSAYSSGLDKLKSGLRFIDRRSSANKTGHIFDIADGDINIDKLITNIDQAKASLSGETEITLYDNYDDETTLADSAGVNLLTLFSSPSIDSLPEFYYHSISDTDMPIFDTNDPGDPPSSSAFVNAVTDVLVRIKKAEDADWTYFTSLEDLLSEDLLPTPYKFVVPTQSITMTGSLGDWDSVNPVMFDDEDDGNLVGLDMLKVYMARDSYYLYLAAKFRGSPYTGPFAGGEYLNLQLKFKISSDDLSWDNTPVILELHGSSTGWEWHLVSYGHDKGLVSEAGFSCAVDKIAECRIPLAYLKDRINEYEPGSSLPGGSWDGKELYVGVSLWSSISSVYYGDWIEACLAELNINNGE